MSHVIAASVKAAVASHAVKQARAFGVDVSQGLTTWTGKTAYATWRQGTNWQGEPNGSVHFRINYPDLHDDTRLTRGEADLIAAYTLHELGHVVFTNNWLSKKVENKTITLKNGFSEVFPQWNGLEDGRMEDCVIRSNQARNARVLFRRLLNKLTVDLPKQWNPCDISHAPFALAILSREAYGNGNAFSKNLLDRIPEPKRGVYERAIEALLKTTPGFKGSIETLFIADKFLSEFKAVDQTVKTRVNDPSPPPPPEKEDWHNDGSREDSADDEFEDPDEIEERVSDEPQGEGSGFPDESGPDEEPGESDDESGESDESDESGDGSDDESDDEADGSGSESDESDDEADGESDGFGEESDESDDDFVKGNPDDSDEQYDNSDGQSDDSSDDASDGSEEASSSADQFEDAKGDPTKAKNPEPSIDDLFKRVNKRSGKQESQSSGAFLPAHRIDNWRGHDQSLSDIEQTFNSVNGSYKTRGKALDSFPHVDKVSIPGLKTNLSRLLISLDQVGWLKGALAGRFDVRKTGRLFCNSEAVFKRRWETESIETALSIVLDMSGSMSGESAWRAFQAAYAIGDAASRVGAKVEIHGFVDGGWGSTLARPPEATMDGKWAKVTARGVDECNAAALAVMKKFDERMSEDVKKRMQAGMFSCWSGTPDYSAVRTVVEALSNRSERRKLVLVLTDGMGDYTEMKELTTHSFRRYGVSVIGIGIGINKDMLDLGYHLNSSVEKIEDLGTVAFRDLMKEIKRVAPETVTY